MHVRVWKLRQEQSLRWRGQSLIGTQNGQILGFGGTGITTCRLQEENMPTALSQQSENGLDEIFVFNRFVQARHPPFSGPNDTPDLNALGGGELDLKKKGRLGHAITNHALLQTLSDVV